MNTAAEHDGTDASRLYRVEEVLGIDPDDRGTGHSILDVISDWDRPELESAFEDAHLRLIMIERRLGIVHETCPEGTTYERHVLGDGTVRRVVIEPES